MATMTSRYPGTCYCCGKRFSAGTEIDYQKSKGAKHSSCIQTVADAEEGPIHLSRGEGYGGRPYEVGAVIRTQWWEGQAKVSGVIKIVTARSQYFREDGLSFGVGDDSGHIYIATARSATDDEMKPLLEREAARDLKMESQTRLNAIFAEIRTGERPTGSNMPDGETIPFGEGQNAYGGGQWFVIGPEWTWAIENHGMDGDDWSANNVRTGGAGAIGWRVVSIPALTAEIRFHAARLGERR